MNTHNPIYRERQVTCTNQSTPKLITLSLFLSLVHMMTREAHHSTAGRGQYLAIVPSYSEMSHEKCHMPRVCCLCSFIRRTNIGETTVGLAICVVYQMPLHLQNCKRIRSSTNIKASTVLDMYALYGHSNWSPPAFPLTGRFTSADSAALEPRPAPSLSSLPSLFFFS